MDTVGSVVKESKRYEAKLTSLIEELETHPETALSHSEAPGKIASEASTSRNSSE